MPFDSLPETKPDAEEMIRRGFMRAAEIIEERGLTKKQEGKKEGGPVCVLRAIQLAFDVPTYSTGSIHYELMDPYARLLGFPDARGAYQWNDRWGIAWRDVIDRLRAAARGEFAHNIEFDVFEIES